MQKIQVFLREDQKTVLEALSARTGVRQSDLVRQGVDLLLEGAAQRPTDWREATRMAAGIWGGSRKCRRGRRGTTRVA
jgi:hypothetical protein